LTHAKTLHTRQTLDILPADGVGTADTQIIIMKLTAEKQLIHSKQ